MEHDFKTTSQLAFTIANLFDLLHLSDKAGLEVLALVVSDVISIPVDSSSNELAEYFWNKLCQFTDPQASDQPT